MLWTQDYDWLLGGPMASESMEQSGARQFAQLGCETCHMDIPVAAVRH